MPQIFQTTQIARPAYYDRQPAIVFGNFSTSVAPHATTTRATYTVPSKRAAYLEVVFTDMIRTVAAGAANQTYIDVVYTPSGSGAGLLVRTYIINNATFVDYSRSQPTAGYMVAGDTIAIQTHDDSTTGTMLFTGSFKGTEFDA